MLLVIVRVCFVSVFFFFFFFFSVGPNRSLPVSIGIRLIRRAINASYRLWILHLLRRLPGPNQQIKSTKNTILQQPSIHLCIYRFFASVLVSCLFRRSHFIECGTFGWAFMPSTSFCHHRLTMIASNCHQYYHDFCLNFINAQFGAISFSPHFVWHCFVVVDIYFSLLLDGGFVQLLFVCEIEHMRMKYSKHHRFCRCYNTSMYDSS